MFYKIAFCVFVILVLILQGVLFYLALSKLRSDEKRFQIDQEFYASAISNSVATYLASFLPSPVKEAKDDPIVPSLAFCDDLATWVDYRGKPFCILNGLKLATGDYCEFGEVVLIKADRVFCRHNGNYVLVRRRVPDGRPAGDGHGDGQAPI